MARLVRNVSFLAFMAVSALVARVAAYENCGSAQYECQILQEGYFQTEGLAYCSQGQLWQDFTCRDQPDGTALYPGTCPLGWSCS
jgi:hypothetical protein